MNRSMRLVLVVSSKLFWIRFEIQKSTPRFVESKRRSVVCVRRERSMKRDFNREEG